MNNISFSDSFWKTLDKCISVFDYYAVIGDPKHDLLWANKSNILLDILEIFNLSKIIKNTTFLKRTVHHPYCHIDK